ncbi:hypothetical protein FA95DRAFT_273986 [Auriscalpium vulgare]|uniref:Uncharacterized protein n=1 Tax=Auriscalpium vulgare TaxID=40419 RepID=A0ACB8S5G8_9AGAM|nr:hypothetical protein FA95DRAFT_273986 [Auriscalpium vulgare]
MWQRFASAILASLRRDTTVPSSDSSDHLSHTPPHLSFKISGARPTRFGSPPPLLAASGVRPWGLAVLADAAAGAVRADQSSTSNFDSASGCLRTILAWHESKSSTGSGDLDWSRPVSLKAVWRALVFSPYKLLGIVLEQSSPSHPPNPSVNCLPPAAESSQVPILTPAGPVEPLEPFGTPSDLAVVRHLCALHEPFSD